MIDKAGRFITHLNKDFSGHINRKLNDTLNPLVLGWFKIINLFNCWFKGIKIGRLPEFEGRTRFERNYNSKIEIGNKCKIVSNLNGNLIGINHRTVIATLRENAIIKIGDNCGISGASICAIGNIQIGNNVLIGANSLITDYDWHNVHPDQRKMVCNTWKPVIIEDNVWLGINTVVLKGVTIGKNSVIGANSLVNKDIPDNVIAGGNPCKVLKRLIQ